jgi:hypothetical protein
MGIPAALQPDVQKLFDAHNANTAQLPTDEILGGYTDGLSSDGSKFIALCFDFEVGSKELRLLHLTDLDNRIIPLGSGASACPMEVFGFASNTTNAAWSHDQNRNLALDRLQQTADHLVKGGVPSTQVTFNFSDSGELGPADLESADERFTMVVVTLNGASPPPPLSTP